VFATVPVRLFVLFSLLALAGFGFAAWNDGAPLGVLVGTLAALAAGLAVAVEVDRGEPAAVSRYGCKR